MSAEPPSSPHFDARGHARMVDVSAKSETVRSATATGDVLMRPATAATIREGRAGKGDVLAVARLAAIQATKWTQHLIPLCHAIPLEAVSVEFSWPESGSGGEPASHELKAAGTDTDDDAGGRSDAVRLRCHVTVRTSGKTGVEMEAMTAASIGCLTVYDMVKSLDRSIAIGPVVLLQKSGGKSGHYLRG